jgi:hypothetical protein
VSRAIERYLLGPDSMRGDNGAPGFTVPEDSVTAPSPADTAAPPVPAPVPIPRAVRPITRGGTQR